MSELLKQKFTDQSARLGIIGLGYVGLPLAVEFAKVGFVVTGIDINDTRIDLLNDGQNYIQDVDDDELKQVVKTGRFHATANFGDLHDLDAVSICVPTPLSKLKDPDVSYILNVLEKLKHTVHKDLLIVLESTTYPGTTRDMVLSELQDTGLKVGEDYFLCFSPERIDPGSKKFSIRNTPRIVGGITETCTELGVALYQNIVDEVVPVSNPETAELVKLLENTFRSINIGLANEMAIMCEKLGVDVWEVIEAADTKPFGFMKFDPGPGLGGHCIPIDPHYLAWKMRTLDYHARFIELAGEINTHMPEHVMELIGQGLNERQKSIGGSRILLLGIAYKRNIDDVRESPALDVMLLLENSGAQVDYFDPYVPQIQWNNDQKHSLTDLTADAINKTDAVVILADHSNVDYDLVKKEADLIIDTRNVYHLNHDKHIIRLGVG